MFACADARSAARLAGAAACPALMRSCAARNASCAAARLAGAAACQALMRSCAARIASCAASMNACADALEFSFLGLDCDLGLERGAFGWGVIPASFVDTVRWSVNSRLGIIEYDDIFIELNATGFRRSPGPSEAFLLVGVSIKISFCEKCRVPFPYVPLSIRHIYT